MHRTYPRLRPRWRALALCAAAFVNLAGSAVLAALVVDESDLCKPSRQSAGPGVRCTTQGEA